MPHQHLHVEANYSHFFTRDSHNKSDITTTSHNDSATAFTSAYVYDTSPQLTDTSGKMITDSDLRYRTVTRCGSIEVSRAFSMINGIFLLTCIYIIPMIVISWMYVQIILFAIRQNKESISGRSISRRKVKIVKMLSWVAFLFAVCWLPYFTLLVIAVSNEISR